MFTFPSVTPPSFFYKRHPQKEEEDQQQHYVGGMCLEDLLENIEVRKTTSQSHSIFIHGDLKSDEIDGDIKAHTPVVVKLALESSQTDNSLEIERAMYMLIKTKLADLSPHFLRGIYAGSCPDTFIRNSEHSPNAQLRKLYESWVQLRQHTLTERLNNEADSPTRIRIWKTWKTKKKKAAFSMREAMFVVPELQQYLSSIYFVVTPKMKGMSLAEFFERRGYMTAPDVIRRHFDVFIALQMAQTFSVLELFEILHNDSHMGNIFLEVSTEPFEIPYRFPTPFTLRTHLRVKLYDFDHSTQPPQYSNLMLENSFCESIGECNQFIANWDWYLFLVHFIYMLERANFVEPRILIKSVLGAEYDKALRSAGNTIEVGQDAFFGRACKCSTVHLDDDTQENVCDQCTIRHTMLQKLQSPTEFFLAYSRKFFHSTIDASGS